LYFAKQCSGAIILNPVKALLPNNFDWVSKNAEFDADFESVEKVLKSFYEKSN
jgi:hypothetical protein